MKRILVLAALAAVAFSCCSKDEYGYTIKDNKIIYNTPLAKVSLVERLQK